MFPAVPFTLAGHDNDEPRSTNVSRDAARREVRKAVEANWTRLAFAKLAQIDPGTLTDFLENRRWPQGPTLAKIEQALGWEVGRIRDMADTPDIPAPARPVGLGLDDAAAGLAPEQVERIRALILDIKGDP
jgi:transcriptional regulator with XRE-family HTH domain